MPRVGGNQRRRRRSGREGVCMMDAAAALHPIIVEGLFREGRSKAGVVVVIVALSRLQLSETSSMEAQRAKKKKKSPGGSWPVIEAKGGGER